MAYTVLNLYKKKALGYKTRRALLVVLRTSYKYCCRLFKNPKDIGNIHDKVCRRNLMMILK